MAFDPRVTPAGVGAFRKPPIWLRPGDEVTIETTVTALRRSSFDVRHHLFKDGALNSDTLRDIFVGRGNFTAVVAGGGLVVAGRTLLSRR